MIEMEKQNYFERLSKDIENEMKLDIISSGLPSSVLEGLFNEEMIKQEIQKSLEHTYQKESYEIDTSVVEENLNKNIQSYLEKNNIVITDEEALKTFVKDTVGIYKSGINLYGYSKYIKQIIIKVKEPISWAMFILIITEVFLIGGMCLLRKENHLGATFLTTAILLFLTTYYINERLDIKHIFIFNEFFSDTIKGIANQALEKMKYSQIILILCFLGWSIGRNKNHFEGIE